MAADRDYKTAHRDGFRVEYPEEDESVLSLYVALWLGGEEKLRRCVWHAEINQEDNGKYAERNRRGKLLAAVLRNIVEGGSLEEIAEVLVQARACIREGDFSVSLPVVAVESEESHARTFLLPDGRYLRIIEGEFTDVLTAEQLLDIAREDTPQLPPEI